MPICLLTMSITVDGHAIFVISWNVYCSNSDQPTAWIALDEFTKLARNRSRLLAARWTPAAVWPANKVDDRSALVSPLADYVILRRATRAASSLQDVATLVADQVTSAWTRPTVRLRTYKRRRFRDESVETWPNGGGREEIIFTFERVKNIGGGRRRASRGRGQTIASFLLFPACVPAIIHVNSDDWPRF